MPQMFPMPFAFLMIMISVLLVLSLVRFYWHNKSFFCLSSSAKSKASLYFNQTW